MKNTTPNKSGEKQPGSAFKNDQLDQVGQAPEENPVDATVEKLSAQKARAGMDNNAETSGKPMIPDSPRPADKSQTSGQ